MSRMSRWFSILAPLVMLVGCDHATKYVAKAELESRAPQVLIASVLDLRYVENTDVAFNLLRWIPEGARRPLLLAFGAVAILVLVAIFLRHAGPRLAKIAFFLIVAGALGNYLDRVFRGYVVDFIHVSYWPVFNVADCYVAVGMVLLGWLSLRHRDGPRPA